MLLLQDVQRGVELLRQRPGGGIDDAQGGRQGGDRGIAGVGHDGRKVNRAADVDLPRRYRQRAPDTGTRISGRANLETRGLGLHGRAGIVDELLLDDVAARCGGGQTHGEGGLGERAGGELRQAAGGREHVCAGGPGDPGVQAQHIEDGVDRQVRDASRQACVLAELENGLVAVDHRH